MTHVINKMWRLGEGLDDFMAAFRAPVKFICAAVNLSAADWEERKNQPEAETLQNKLIISPFQTVIACFQL